MGNPGQGQSRVDSFPTYAQSGQFTCTVSGTSYSLPDIPCTDIIIIPHPSNSGVVWVGNSTGTVNGATGYPLHHSTRNPIIFSGVSNLNYLKVCSDANGDKVCWLVETLE